MQSRNLVFSLSRVRSETRHPTRLHLLLSQSVQDDPLSLPASQSPTLISPYVTEENHGPRRQSSDLYGDIEALAAMLGFSCEEEGRGDGEEEVEDGFYERVAGVKGPRCVKEKRRVEGWIRHYLGSKEEPLRLIHLMIGRIVVEDAEFEFPSTVDGFLHVDPPIPCCSNQDNDQACVIALIFRRVDKTSFTSGRCPGSELVQRWASLTILSWISHSSFNGSEDRMGSKI